MRYFGMGALVAGMCLALPVAAQNVVFGTDNGEWAKDGECDDPRFAGPGMTTTPLLADDILADATDCRAGYEAGKLMLIGVSNGVINFGDDLGEWANDGECDDLRFYGGGMTSTPLLSDDIMHDATDCKAAYDAGQIQLVGN